MTPQSPQGSDKIKTMKVICPYCDGTGTPTYREKGTCVCRKFPHKRKMEKFDWERKLRLAVDDAYDGDNYEPIRKLFAQAEARRELRLAKEIKERGIHAFVIDEERRLLYCQSCGYIACWMDYGPNNDRNIWAQENLPYVCSDES